MFYVVCGEYVDTTFQDLIPGTSETHGPFDCYGAALKVWRAVTGRNVDNCHHRATIVENSRDEVAA